MSITKPSLADVVPWAGTAASGDIATPTTAQQAAGFTQTPAAPPQQWLNWLQKFVSSAAIYLMGRGITDYDPAVVYSNLDTVRYESTVYENLGLGAPAGTLPTDASNWQVFGASWILTDAIKTSLASALPSMMLATLKTLLGLQLGYSDAAAATFDCGGFRINVASVTLNVSNGNVTTTTFNWRQPFGLIFGALSNPVNVDIITALAPTTSACTIIPFGGGNSAVVFVVGFGTTPA